MPVIALIWEDPASSSRAFYSAIRKRPYTRSKLSLKSIKMTGLFTIWLSSGWLPSPANHIRTHCFNWQEAPIRITSVFPAFNGRKSLVITRYLPVRQPHGAMGSTQVRNRALRVIIGMHVEINPKIFNDIFQWTEIRLEAKAWMRSPKGHRDSKDRFKSSCVILFLLMLETERGMNSLNLSSWIPRHFTNTAQSFPLPHYSMQSANRACAARYGEVNWTGCRR